MDLETLDLHKQTGLAAIPYSAQANGFYQKLAAGAHERLSSFMRAVYLHPTNTARLQRILKLAQETGWSITQITLGYLVSQPFTTIPIVGCHTHEQLADSLSAAEVKLTPDQVSFLEG
jgi:aryl-alcohol dehydrogenase-like predicted oxidoreductase